MVPTRNNGQDIQEKHSGGNQAAEQDDMRQAGIHVALATLTDDPMQGEYQL
jgi:hypothetical protein